MNNSLFWILLGFTFGILFLASIYPIILDQFTCPDFLSIETCQMSTYHAMVVDIITTIIFTIILAYFIYDRTKKSMREAIHVEIGSLEERIRIDTGSFGRLA